MLQECSMLIIIKKLQNNKDGDTNYPENMACITTIVFDELKPRHYQNKDTI